MTKPAPLPSSGGSYIRNPLTGALSLAGELDPAPVKTTLKGGVKPASKPATGQNEED